MKVSDIKTVINNFIKSNSSAILIDGQWGIGKTHNVKEFINGSRKNKKLRFAYVSLFGKESINEINTVLYNILNPKKSMIINLVNKATKLVNVGATFEGLSLNVNTEELKKKGKLKKAKKQTIIILDDLERLDKKKITINNLWGFIDSLINQNLKIILLANLEENKDEKSDVSTKADPIIKTLGDFAEKILDRLYIISDTSEDVIKLLLGDNAKYIKEEHYKIFDNNLRMVKKSSNLLTQILNKINENDKSDKIDADFNKLFIILIMIFQDQFTQKYSEPYLLDEKNIYAKDLSAKALTSSAIYDYASKELDDFLDKYYNFIYGLYDIVSKDDYKYLFDLLFPDNNGYNVFESVFFKSDADKISHIKKQMDFILSIENKEDASIEHIPQFIRDWYKYCGYIDLSFINLNLIYEKIYNLNIEMHDFPDEPECSEFIKNYGLYKNKKLSEEIINSFKTLDKKRILNTLHNYKHFFNKLDIDEIKQINEYLISSDFFITELHGNMNKSEWDFAHKMCDFIANYNNSLKVNLYTYLENYKQKDSKNHALNERVNYLIDHYKLNSTIEADNL